MEANELAGFRETARRFARREVAPLVGTEKRDGSLDQIPGLLTKAAEVGLLASPAKDAPGREYGVWGTASQETGPAPSLAVLQELARECAGVAACVHAAGLGALAAAGDPRAGHRPALAWWDRTWRMERRDLAHPPDAALRLHGHGLRGAASFVHQAPGTDGYVVLAAGDGGWERLYVPRDAAGVAPAPVGPRTGLAAVAVTHLRFEDHRVSPDQRLGSAPAPALLAAWTLGAAALAAGNARGALDVARTYATERYQGGALIGAHPAVRDLLAGAAARITLAEAALDDVGPTLDLTTALALKLRIAEDARVATSDCLQVLGGYGYMEEYRQEKRLRDALTLEALHPSPATSQRLIAADLFEEGP